MVRRYLLPFLLLGTLSVACATVSEEELEDVTPGAGGTSGDGGSASGGDGSGGDASGGSASGGSASGGSASGGSGSGGVFGVGGSSGGSASGGSASGGAATGGAASGGAASGGAASGGAASGGAATGGAGGGLNCSGAVAWVGGQHSVNYPPGQLFTYKTKTYRYDGAEPMTFVNADCPPDQSGQPWCQTGQYPWSEVTTCP